MWLPHCPDTVVVVESNPTDEPVRPPQPNGNALAPLQALLQKLQPSIPSAELKAMSFAQLRDILLEISPLDVEHVKAVNRAEAKFWELSAGTRVDWSDRVLGFECGGQQWVWENVFPVGP